MDITQTCPDCQDVFCADTMVPRRCPACQKKEAGDDTEVNYSCPEQPSRRFDRSDIEDLLRSLDNDIRRLEGMRGVEFGRNYLNPHERDQLNRAKLTRMIVTKYMEQNP